MVRFFEAGRRHGTRWAPVRCSLSVEAGEMVWLSGPPGAGKSSLARMAACLVLPSSGSVEVNGVNPARLSRGARRALRRRISAVFDDEPALSREAMDWVALGLWCAGRQPWKRARQTARDRLEEFGLVEFVHRPYDRLSHGQKFAVSLARGLLRGPELLLMDWAGAFAEDLPGRLMQELAEYVRNGGSVLAIGEPDGAASELGGRRERLELDRAGTV